MRIDITELFCNIDDFWIDFEKEWKQMLIGKQKRAPRRRPSLHTSEVITIVILFHRSGFRNFKTFYKGYVLVHLVEFFPSAPSYQRFVELKKSIIFPLHCYLMRLMGKPTGISFVDSTSLAVCHSKRIYQHKVFKGMARRGKTSVGWFYGFKLHIIVNDEGELLSFALTPGNVDDRAPVSKLVKENISGLLFGDRGYISSKLATTLRKQGVQLITRLRSNMKNKFMPFMHKMLLRKRGIVETVIDQLKNISQIEHSRHRSPYNFIVNLLAGLIAYSHQPKKPSLNLRKNETNMLTVC